MTTLTRNRISPTFRHGFARSAVESAYPWDWHGLVGAWVPALGISGLMLRDVSGRGNHASFPGGTSDPVWTLAPERGIVLDFDGSDDYVDLSTPLGTHDYIALTFMAWYKSTDTSASDDEYIYAHDGNSGANSDDDIIFGMTDDAGEEDHVRMIIRLDGTAPTVYSTTDVVDQTWHHVVGVRTGGSGSRLKIYVDGVEEADIDDTTNGGTVSISASLSDGPFIGDIPGATEQVHGQLDDIRFYNCALSPTHIREIYQDSMRTWRRARRVRASVETDAAAGSEGPLIGGRIIRGGHLVGKGVLIG